MPALFPVRCSTELCDKSHRRTCSTADANADWFNHHSRNKLNNKPTVRHPLPGGLFWNTRWPSFNDAVNSSGLRRWICQWWMRRNVKKKRSWQNERYRIIHVFSWWAWGKPQNLRQYGQSPCLVSSSRPPESSHSQRSVTWTTDHSILREMEHNSNFSNVKLVLPLVSAGFTSLL